MYSFPFLRYIPNLAYNVRHKSSAIFRCSDHCNKYRRRCHGNAANSQQQRNYEGDVKTTVTLLNQAPEAVLMINSYSPMGFRLNNGFYIIGPMAIFPRTVLTWNVGTADEINIDAFSLFVTMVPKLDVLIVSAGDAYQMPIPVRQFLMQKKISVEVLPPHQACSTFNFLNSEGRSVAGAIIPPIMQLPEIERLVTERESLLLEDKDDDKSRTGIYKPRS